MKKYLLLTCYVFMLSLSLFAQEKLSIGIMVDAKSNDNQTLYEQLTSEINHLVGKEYVIDFQEVLSCDNDPQKARLNYKTLVDNKADIILSFGIANSIMFYESNIEFEVPTILLSFVNKDIIDEIPFRQKSSGIKNFTYFITPYSYKDDLKDFSQLVKYQHVGIVVDDYVLELTPIVSFLEHALATEDFKYTLIPVQKGQKVDLPSDIDAVYVNSVSQLSKSELLDLITEINTKKLPSFSAYGVKEVEMGILATNQPKVNIDQIFRRIALTIEAISSGEDAATLPVEVNYDKELTINLQVADWLGLNVTNSELVQYNLVDEKINLNQEQFSLKQLMNLMVNQNLELDVERKNIELKNQEVKLSKSNYLPEVAVNAGGNYLNPEMAELSFGQNPEYMVNGNVQLNQIIYSAAASANISISKSNLKAQKEEYNAKELDALLEIGTAYFNTLIFDANKHIQFQNLSLTKENLKLSEQNIELGVGGKSDLLRFRSQLAQNTQSMIEAKNAEAQSHLVLNQLLNLPMEENIALKDSLMLFNEKTLSEYNGLISLLDNPRDRMLLIDFLIDEAKVNAPELKGIEYSKEAINRNYKLQKNGRFLPTVALQGQYNQFLYRDGAGMNLPAGFPEVPLNNYTVGVNVSIPIFQQNTRNVNQQKTKIQYDQLLVQKNQFEVGIDKYIHEIILALTNEIANIEISKSNLEVSQENVALSQDEYANGIIPVIQLIDAQNDFLETQLALTTAQYNYFMVSLQLQRAIGHFFIISSEEKNTAFMARAMQYIRQ
ncbi:TolC family protein [Flammeovirga agarivorans]|uniref:TolC family protein n=1 Tax=Flammeovirga agarivorans TaxID=2726742 RepID=A0A7X8XY55_9BACT|nr:TolC family protein [Flammeovirga agarivorans]NLR93901.1 TolC family protein [Flammeovirga agarivorans]